MGQFNNSEYVWWQGAAIYQIYPRSFVDSNGNGIGDLNGIIAKLDYVAELGVDGIWISPFFTSPMKDFGYDVSNYREVDPVFGDIADFKRLVEKAHSLDLKVIIDQVYSHSSDQHQWFLNSRQNKTNPQADWYVWADPKPDGTPPNNWQSIFGGSSWSWDNYRKQYYLHNFLPSQPDLNLHNPEVQQALIDIAKFWLDLGVDGFRLDAINCGMHDPELTDNPAKADIDPTQARPYTMQLHKHNMSQPGMLEFLKKLRSELDNYRDIFTVAEVGGDDPVTTMKSYISGNNKLSTAYSFEFLSMFALEKASFTDTLKRWSNTGEQWPSWAFSNHDARRVLTRWSNDNASEQKAKLYLLLLASLRGNIFVYQGEELGLDQSDIPFEKLQDPEAIANWPDNLGRDGARTPIPWHADRDYFGFSPIEPWLPTNSHRSEQAVNVQEKQLDSVLAFSKSLFNFRKNSAVLRLGHLDFIDTDNALIAFMRTEGNSRYLCLFNNTNKALSLSQSENVEGKVLLSNVTNGVSLQNVPAYSGAIFELA